MFFNNTKIITCSKHNYTGINNHCPDCEYELAKVDRAELVKKQHYYHKKTPASGKKSTHWSREEGFWEWWTVTDGDKSFKCDDEADAKWLCDLLNRTESTSTQTKEI